MISRLKEIAKRAATVIATGIITLTALPAYSCTCIWRCYELSCISEC